MYALQVICKLNKMTENDKFCHFVSVLKRTRNVISGIRYIRFALHPVWAVSLYPVYVKSCIRYIRFAQKKITKGGPFQQ